MRRILNLNQVSIVFVQVFLLFTAVIPAVLYGISFLLNESEIASALRLLIRISLGVGASVFVVFLVLIIFEQIQDHWIDVQHQKNQNHKLLLANGNYECQYCGNQKLKEKDRTCWVCGRELK
jgi:uncharacterized paraquat-inducible protein A